MVQIEPLIDEVLGVFQSVAEERKIELVKVIGLPGLQLNCDHLRMIQVFSNLIGNSIKYSGPGSTITISVEALGKEVKFSVADNGPGISEDQVRHVFDRFWQAKSTAHLGVGLGLSIAKGIIDAHGGKIWVVSKLGKGSTFTFTLKKVALSTKNLIKIS
jgi:signal transduction histidine kinase